VDIIGPSGGNSRAVSLPKFREPRFHPRNIRGSISLPQLLRRDRLRRRGWGGRRFGAGVCRRSCRRGGEAAGEPSRGSVPLRSASNPSVRFLAAGAGDAVGDEQFSQDLPSLASAFFWAVASPGLALATSMSLLIHL